MYQLDKLKNIPGLVHGFSDIKDGNMSFDWGESDSVIKNRSTFLSRLGINSADCIITRTRMSHGTEIEIVNSSLKGRGINLSASGDADVDAMMTSDKNLFLAILTADCLPVVIYDPIKKAITLVHLSRINTPKNFARNVIDKMKTEYNSISEDIVVGIGPYIHKESYLFEKAELEKVIPNRKNFGRFILDLPNGKAAIDLAGYNVEEFISAGVLNKNIEVSEIDTATNTNFFSHCRSRLAVEPEGRMLTVVGMV